MLIMMDGALTQRKTLQRARGTVDVGFATDALARLYQAGAAKALLPRSYGPAHEVVLVNTAGGITGGDKFDYRCVADASNMIVTTQAAERAYRSSTADIASMNVALQAKCGARLHWLPQETILFDGSRLARRIYVDLDTDSECLLLESLVFGRHAMGEILQHCHFTDHWHIRRQGQLVHAEALQLTGDIAARLGAMAGAAHAQMMATLIYVGPRLEAIRPNIQPVLSQPGLRTALSVWQGKLVLRLLAEETMTGKAGLSQILGAIRGQQLPRVWQS